MVSLDAASMSLADVRSCRIRAVTWTMIFTVLPAATAAVTGVLPLTLRDVCRSNPCWSAPKPLRWAGAKGRGLAKKARCSWLADLHGKTDLPCKEAAAKTILC
jgi:hypothetical protein